MLPVAIVGAGKAGENHLRAMQRVADVRVLGVCDAEPLMAEQLACRFAVPRHYSDFDAMLATEAPAVVHITTPPQSHRALAMRAFDAGCHVMLEKPLAPTLADADEIIQHALRRHRLLTIAYGYYFDPVARAMRRMVADGVLGDPVHVESFLGYALDGPFGAPVVVDPGHWVHELPGKLLHNVIDHILNKVSEFVRGSHPQVLVRASQLSVRDHLALHLPDEVRMMIADDRVSAYATFSAHARPLSHHFTVYGTRNTLHLDFLNGTLTTRSASPLPGPIGRIASAFDQSWQHFGAGARNVVRFGQGDFQHLSGLRHLITSFYDSVRAGAPLPLPYAEMLRVSALTEAVVNQLRVPQHRSA